MGIIRNRNLIMSIYEPAFSKTTFDTVDALKNMSKERT
jgi:hypothetical protein